MKLIKIKTLSGKSLSTQEGIKLARKIRRWSRKNLNLPDDFDVVKFMRDNR